MTNSKSGEYRPIHLRMAGARTVVWNFSALSEAATSLREAWR